VPVLLASVLFFVVNKGFKELAKRERFIKVQYFAKLKIPFLFILSLLVIMQEAAFFEWKSAVFDQMVQIGWIVAISSLLIRMTAVGRMFLLNRYRISDDTNVKAKKVYTQIRVFERVVNVVIVILATGLTLMTFEGIKEIGLSILTSAGIAGIIVGLAAQKLLGNLLAGLQIAITQPIRLEDVVIVENDFGWIDEINLTYVVVRSWDYRRIVLPSTYFIEKPFENWTRTSGDILNTIYFYFDYRFPTEVLRQKAREFAAESEYWDGNVCKLQITGLTEKSMECRILVSARSAMDNWDLRVFLRERLIVYLQKHYAEYLPKLRVELGESKADFSQNGVEKKDAV
jgi:small-conductance mechanosensitive channel